LQKAANAEEFILTAKVTNTKIKEALDLTRKVLGGFPIEHTEIAKSLDAIERGYIEGNKPKIAVAYARIANDHSKSPNDMLYSVKINVNGKEHVFSLEVSKVSTMLAYERNGKPVEVLSQEKDNVIHQKFGEG